MTLEQIETEYPYLWENVWPVPEDGDNFMQVFHLGNYADLIDRANFIALSRQLNEDYPAFVMVEEGGPGWGKGWGEIHINIHDSPEGLFADVDDFYVQTSEYAIYDENLYFEMERQEQEEYLEDIGLSDLASEFNIDLDLSDHRDRLRNLVWHTHFNDDVVFRMESDGVVMDYDALRWPIDEAFRYQVDGERIADPDIARGRIVQLAFAEIPSGTRVELQTRSYGNVLSFTTHYGHNYITELP